MADISLFEDDYEDSGGDGTDNELGYNYDYGTDYDLTLLQKMEKYMDSDHTYHRIMVAKSLTDTLRWVAENESEGDASSVLACLARLSEDPEANIRLDLMDQIPHIITYCHENPDIFGPGVPFMSNYILPIICRSLTDDHHMIRKTCQAALLVLLEQDLIDKDDFEEQVCPVIYEMTNYDDELKIEAIALMSKMSPLVGQEFTIRMFMDRFTQLCTDTLFHVRKVCASNFGDMCTVIGQEKTETVLLSKFKLLCEDRVWGIRRSCAECFMAVSCCVSQEVRVQELSCLFLQLLGDPSSRWVRQAAFQALGGFISTFADPDSTGLYFNEQGLLVAGSQDFPASPTQSITPPSTQSSETQEKLEQPSDSEKSSDSEESSTKPPPPPSSPSSEEVPEDKESSKMQENNNSSGDCDCSSGASGNPESSQEAPGSPGQASVPESLQVVDNTSNSAGADDDRSVQDMEIDTEIEGASSSSESIMLTPVIDYELSLEESRAQHLANSTNNSGNGDDNNAGKSGAQQQQPQPTGDSTSSSTSNANDTAKSSTVESSTNAPSSNEVSSSSSGHNDNQSSREQQHGQTPKRSSGTESFNSFQFWREPLPVIDVATDLQSKTKSRSQRAISTQQSRQVLVAHSAQSASSSTESEDESGLSVYMANLTSLEEQPEYVANIGSTHVLGQHVSETTMTVVNGIVQDIGSQNIHWETTSSEAESDDTPEERNVPNFRRDPELTKQDVVPQLLLDHYLSMTDNIHIQKTDQDIARHCAYSLPAVAYTLGKKYWPCLQDLYETLASDMQWKVRRTLAFSIHELAVILGEDITTEDLVPVFNGFLKDLDEVRIGVLKHFADFLKLLKPERRREYLAKMPEFLNVDNNRNWRFREELACQLVVMAELFSAEDDEEHLLPVAILLAEDKVSLVRKTAFKVLAAVLKRFSQEDLANGDNKHVGAFVADVIPRFAHSNRWNQRQIFAQLCEEVLAEDALGKELFAQALLPDLLTLAADAIPNVRIAAAKVLSLHVLRSEYFTSPNNPEHERLLSTQQKLQSDKDRDVRFFIQHNYEEMSFSSLDHMIPV